jgi:hypothetical protein
MSELGTRLSQNCFTVNVHMKRLETGQSVYSTCGPLRLLGSVCSNLHHEWTPLQPLQTFFFALFLPWKPCIFCTMPRCL